MVQQQVHLLQGFLHVLDMAGSTTDQHGPLAQIAAQDDNLIGGAESALQQAEGMQLLQPLAIQHVRLTPADILDFTSVSEQHL